MIKQKLNYDKNELNKLNEDELNKNKNKNKEDKEGKLNNIFNPSHKNFINSEMIK